MTRDEIEAAMPAYGAISFDELKIAIGIASGCGEWEPREGPDCYIGHCQTSINMNSLSRIVSAFISAALARAEKAERERDAYAQKYRRELLINECHCTNIGCLTDERNAAEAEAARLREALEKWQEWWELPWEAKRPDIASLCHQKARAALARQGGGG